MSCALGRETREKAGSRGGGKSGNKGTREGMENIVEIGQVLLVSNDAF
jgi:hypothetical protein